MVVRWGLGSFKFVLRWWGATPVPGWDLVWVPEVFCVWIMYLYLVVVEVGRWMK